MTTPFNYRLERFKKRPLSKISDNGLNIFFEMIAIDTQDTELKELQRFIRTGSYNRLIIRTKENAFNSACSANHFAFIKKMWEVENGTINLDDIPLSENDNLYRNALLIAATTNTDSQTISFLLKNGAYPKQTDRNDNNALISHCSNRYKITNSLDETDIIETMIKHGVEVNHKNKIGKTALMYAVALKNIPAIVALIRNGAKTRVKDHFGKTIKQVLKYKIKKAKDNLKKYPHRNFKINKKIKELEGIYKIIKENEKLVKDNIT